MSASQATRFYLQHHETSRITHNYFPSDILSFLLCPAIVCNQIFISQSLLDRQISHLLPPINTNYLDNRKLEGLKGRLESVAVKTKTNYEQASTVQLYKGITPFLTFPGELQVLFFIDLP